MAWLHFHQIKTKIVLICMKTTPVGLICSSALRFSCRRQADIIFAFQFSCYKNNATVVSEIGGLFFLYSIE